MKKLYFLLFALLISSAMFAQVEVIFRVDMNTIAADAGGVWVTGDLMSESNLGTDDWQEPGSVAGSELTDPDGNGVYTLSVMLDPGSYAYKFANGTGWPNGEAGGDNDNYQADLSSCGGTDNGYGGYNRNMTVPAEGPYNVPTYLFNTCEATTVSTSELSTLSGVKMSPNPATSKVQITFENNSNANHIVSVYTLTGQLVNQLDNGAANNLELDVTSYAAGMYIVTFQNDLGEVGSKKLIVE